MASFLVVCGIKMQLLETLFLLTSFEISGKNVTFFRINLKLFSQENYWEKLYRCFKQKYGLYALVFWHSPAVT